MTHVFEPYKFYDKIVRNDFNIFCEKYLKNYQIIDSSNFGFINTVHDHHDVIYSKSVSYYFKNLGKRKNKISNIMRNMINRGHKITHDQYLQSCLAQESLTRKFEKMMIYYDFLLTPSTASVAPKIGQIEKKDTCLIWNFFGAPTISLPLFYDREAKLPFGLQIIALRYNDFQLLDFCNEIIKKIEKRI